MLNDVSPFDMSPWCVYAFSYWKWFDRVFATRFRKSVECVCDSRGILTAETCGKQISACGVEFSGPPCHGTGLGRGPDPGSWHSPFSPRACWGFFDPNRILSVPNPSSPLKLSFDTLFKESQLSSSSSPSLSPLLELLEVSNGFPLSTMVLVNP